MRNGETLPEYETVEAFAEFLADEDRETFDAGDLARLNFSTHRPVRELRAELEGYGYSLAERRPASSVRGFTTSSHDRWYGPGACPTHGGSGWEVIAGFATTDGFATK